MWPPRLMGPFEQGIPGAETGDPEKMATKARGGWRLWSMCGLIHVWTPVLCSDHKHIQTKTNQAAAAGGGSGERENQKVGAAVAGGRGKGTAVCLIVLFCVFVVEKGGRLTDCSHPNG